MSLYNLPKDMLVKLVCTIREQTIKEIKSLEKYYVIQMNPNEHFITVYNEDSLREFLVHNIEKITHYFMEEDINDREEEIENLKQKDTKSLIELAITLGEYISNQKLGTGVVAVIKGLNDFTT